MKTYIYKGLIVIQFFFLAFVIFTVMFMLSTGTSGSLGAVYFFSCVVFMWPYLLKRDKECFIAVKISETQVSSHLFFKKRCTVLCDRPVYTVFFKELLRAVDPNEAHDYVMVSNSPISDFAPDTRFKTFDMSTQIIFPDTEKTREAITPLLASEFCVLQSGDPPPVETLWKKKKEEPPVVKREKSPDDPPPFTGKWNGRF